MTDARPRMARPASGEVVRTTGDQAAGEVPFYPLAEVFRESFLGKFDHREHQEALRGFDRLLSSLVTEGYYAVENRSTLDLDSDVKTLVSELEQVVLGLEQVHRHLNEAPLNAAEARLALTAGDTAGKIRAVVKELEAAVERYGVEATGRHGERA